MEENLPTPKSPPLPKKGSYNFDFDNFDEFSNPFESKSNLQMGSSPPIQSNSAHRFDDNEDPFKSKKTLANSPPGSPKFRSQEDQGEIEKNSSNDTGQIDGQGPEKIQSTSVESKPSTQVTPKKKRLIKKPQVQSKFKPPKNVKRQNNPDDIEIIMPGMDNFSDKPTSDVINDFAGEAKEDSSCQSLPAPSDDVLSAKNNFTMDDMEDDGPPPQDAAPDAMALSTEIDRRFIDEDDIDDQLNGVASSQEEFKDARDWSSPKQGKKKIPETSNIDFSEPSEKSDTATPPSRSDIERHMKSGGENAEVGPSSQALSESSKEKHPAARALETTQGGDSFASGKSSMDKNRVDMQSAEKKDTVVTLVQVLRYSQTDWNKMKQELELSFQTSLLNKERDWSRLLADRDKKISSLDETNKKLKSTNEDMRAVVTEFEKTIAQLQSEKDKLKSESHKTTQDLEGERNQALEDLASVESAFSDLHRRYEKSKTIIEGFKRNEEQLKECMEDLKSKLKKSESKLTALRSQAEEKLDKANEDIDKIKKSTKSEVVRLEAALKKSELRNSSLDEALSRKEKENQELTAICDELIAKVGS